MALRLLLLRGRLRLPLPLGGLRSHPFLDHSTAASDQDPPPQEEEEGGELVNELCRALSDHRLPHHDLESALAPFSPRLTPALAEHVLRRCCHGLPLPCHRFFLWSSSLPSFSHTPLSPLLLLSSLSRPRLFPLAWDLLASLPPSPRHFWLLFRAYSRARLPSDALRALSRMSDLGLRPAPPDYLHLLLNLSRYRLMDAASLLLHRIRSEFPRDHDIARRACTLVASGWVRAGRPADALKVFDEMRASVALAPDVPAYNTYISALCVSGDLAAAQGVPDEMRARGLDPDASTYSVLLRAHCEAGDAHAADRLMRRMGKLGLVPNVFTYNCMVKMLCQSGESDEAYAVLEEMAERGVKPDLWSYNMIMAVHCRRREVNRGLKLLKTMYEESSCLPDLHTYNMLLKMLIEVGRFDRVEEVWDGMWRKGFHPSSSTYAVMIHGLCKKKGKAEDACKYFELMVEEGVPPYQNTCEVLRDLLIRQDLLDNLHVIRGKMQRSTSRTIQELSDLMVNRRRKNREVCRDEEYGLCDSMD